jgi:hypothetical protein
MKIAIIKSGFVLNTIDADAGFAQSLVDSGVADSFVEIKDGVSPGDSYDGKTFTPAPPSKDVVNGQILFRIDTIEKGMGMSRALREQFVQNGPTPFVKSSDDQIAKLRSQLVK